VIALPRAGRAVVAAAVVAGVLLALAFSPAAHARAPELLTVGQQDRYANASWTLPPGVKARFVEVGETPEVTVDGYFRYLLDFAVLDPNDTSYQEKIFRLPPGTYYLHVAGQDYTYPECGPREFSAIVKLVITATGGGSGGVVAQGSPQCPPPSGGGGGGGPVGGKGSPISSLVIRRVQDIDRLQVITRLLERATVRVSATVRIAGAAKLVRFRPVKRTLPADVRTKLRVRVGKAKLRIIKRALRRGKRLRAKIKVTAVSTSGGRGAVSRTVRLKP
jgi:hypothetical protein